MARDHKHAWYPVKEGQDGCTTCGLQRTKMPKGYYYRYWRYSAAQTAVFIEALKTGLTVSADRWPRR
jgi:hypothetical protein